MLIDEWTILRRRIELFTPDKKKAKPGDIVEFKKNDFIMKGVVLPSSCKKSIIVDIESLNNLKKLPFGYPNTVVAHHKYRVVDKK